MGVSKMNSCRVFLPRSQKLCSYSTVVYFITRVAVSGDTSIMIKFKIVGGGDLFCVCMWEGGKILKSYQFYHFVQQNAIFSSFQIWELVNGEGFPLVPLVPPVELHSSQQASLQSLNVAFPCSNSAIAEYKNLDSMFLIDLVNGN